MTYRTAIIALALGAISCSALGNGTTSETPHEEAIKLYAQRLPQDEVVYFLLPDRFENGDSANDTGGVKGDRLVNGFDPTSKGFFHGGDLKGLTQRLDYIQGMGVTAIWLAPIFQNKAVQGAKGSESAGYHGYWITDFTKVDSHFGTNDDMRAFVDAAHKRGMKVYMDIVTNHTADVIAYRECEETSFDASNPTKNVCTYRSKADYPFTTQGDINGAPINTDFMGDRPPFQTKENFEGLKRTDFAYTPYIPKGEEDVKTPAWLNDLRYYHNRGDSTFEGESSLYGDFGGLDDINTEDPRVVAGFIDIFKQWISDYHIDGFRVDTARHVNAEYWQAFIPAIREHAASLGIPNFYIFGEIGGIDPAELARHTRVDGFPSVLDFAFQHVAKEVFVDGASTDRFDALYAADSLYEGGEETALALPTFLGNHDRGRLAGFLRQNHPKMSDQEIYSRVRAATAFMFFSRGVPVIYSGDEQGFVSDGIDQDAREDMFPSKVAIYNDNDLIATDATTAISNFDTSHPLYKDFAAMARLYHQYPALRRGQQKLRLTEKEGGIVAFSRTMPGGEEYLIIINTRAQTRTVQISVDPRSERFESLYGQCAPSVQARSSYGVTIDGFGVQVCKALAQKETP